MRTVFAGFLAVVGCLTVVDAYSGGPPTSACASMTPSPAAGNHGAAPQTGAHTYTVTVSKTSYMPGDTITVTLSSSNAAVFKGVFVQARLKGSSSNNAQGTFMLTQGETQMKLLDCGGAGKAASHSSAADKTSKTVMWKAPDTNVGDVEFRATFVQNKATFWVGVTSTGVMGSGSGFIAPQSMFLVALIASTCFLQRLLS